MTKVYLLVGCPGSGKTWVCSQLKDEYTYIPHDDYIDTGSASYIKAICQAYKTSTKPILIETPFSMSQIIEPLDDHGIKTINVFITDEPKVIASRYMEREGKAIPPGHLSRQKTYLQRMHESNSTGATSEQLVSILKQMASRKE